MCVDGVNSSQLKLSLNQINEMGNLLQRMVHQWSHLIEHSGIADLSKDLEASENLINESCQKIKEVLDKLDSHHHGEEDITVKKV